MPNTRTAEETGEERRTRKKRVPGPSEYPQRQTIIIIASHRLQPPYCLAGSVLAAVLGVMAMARMHRQGGGEIDIARCVCEPALRKGGWGVCRCIVSRSNTDRRVGVCTARTGTLTALLSV